MNKIPLYITYNESRHEVDNDRDRRETRTDYEVTGVCLKKPDIRYHEEHVLETEQETPTKVWVLWARYSDGDTFSTSRGLGHIVGVFDSREKAVAIEDDIHNGKPDQRKGYAHPWGHYFSGLESTGIEVFDLLDHPKKTTRDYRGY